MEEYGDFWLKLSYISILVTTFLCLSISVLSGYAWGTICSYWNSITDSSRSHFHVDFALRPSRYMLWSIKTVMALLQRRRHEYKKCHSRQLLHLVQAC